MTASVALDYLGSRARLTGEERDVAWLLEFLEPWFGRTPAPPGGDETAISWRRDDELFARLRRRPELDHEVAMFSLDRGPVLVDEVGAADAERCFFDPRMEVFYRLRDSGRSISVVGRRQSPRLLVAVMRIVRELAMSHCRSTGRVVMHAAAFSLGGSAVVAAGPREAGKTSLLVRCLLEAGAAFLANDRVALAMHEEGLTARGMPTLVSLRPESRRLFPALERRLEAEAYDYRSTLDEHASRHRPRRTVRADRSVDLTPRQLTAAMDVAVVAAAPVRLLLLLGPRSTARTRWRRLDPAEAARRLADNVCAGGETSEILRVEGACRARELGELCADLASAADSFELSVGRLDRSPEESPSIAEQIAARLEARPGTRVRDRPASQAPGSKHGWRADGGFHSRS